MKKIFLVILIILFGRAEFFGQNGYLGGNIGSIDDSKGYISWTGTAFLSALNSLTIVGNLRKINKPDKYKSNAIFWIITGTFQSLIGVGLTQDKSSYKNADIEAGINIGVGLATITASIIRLSCKSRPKESKVTYNFYYLPSSYRNYSMAGLRMAIRLH